MDTSPENGICPAPGRRSRFALFDYGFRPFFLLAGLYAALAIPVWMSVYYGLGPSPRPLSGLAWHAHEMLYGFVMAGVAGFLLTAVPSWTARRGFAGGPLFILVLVWLAGRVVVSLPLGLTPVLIAAVDLAFAPLLAAAILPSLVRSGSWRNLVFVAFLALLFAANLHFHLAGADSTKGLRLALNVMLLMVTVVGGRVVPAFTNAALKQRGREVRIRSRPAVDVAALAMTAAVVVVDLLVPDGRFAGTVAAAAALLLAVRLARWQGHRILAQPIVWVLHVAYAWLPLALGLKAAEQLGAPLVGASWIHALTSGAFATMILAIMSRAALGHTGRALIAPRAVAFAYVVVTAAALIRVFGPAVAPAASALLLGASAFLWSTAFALFVIVYAPILCQPRVDGRPG